MKKVGEVKWMSFWQHGPVLYWRLDFNGSSYAWGRVGLEAMHNADNPAELEGMAKRPEDA